MHFIVPVLFRDQRAAEVLADTVAAYDGILGAAVCCSDKGGLETDDWTTCDQDRSTLLDRIFTLAKQRGLLLDFHVDENGNERSKGLREISLKTMQHGYEGRVVCGHCWCAPCSNSRSLHKEFSLQASFYCIPQNQSFLSCEHLWVLVCFQWDTH